ncbi:MAG: hypothetical protein AB7T63_09980 [Planctomycetota bacterium]
MTRSRTSAAPDGDPPGVDPLWMRELGALPREDARPVVRARLLASTLPPARAGWLERAHRAVEQSFAHRAAWGAAACALLAVGVGAGLRLGGDDRLDAPPAQPVVAQEAAASDGRIVILDDPRMGLMHGLETFDRIGVADADLLADWGR